MPKNEKTLMNSIDSELSDAGDPYLLTQAQRDSSPELAWVDSVSRLLDTKFRIPGTNTRYGVDFILGLVPGFGDALSMGFSGVLIATMARHGASPRLVARMLFNVALDTLVGSIPVLGNLFDLYYKANYRNAKLMREYYDDGKHTGSVWPLVIGILVVMGVLFAGSLYLCYRLGVWIWNAIS
ncbi:DUF4112 domain-containing protein [Stieleria varia]|uniref:DUF4112 domain-containing protein n=1 Tax=Stieleria varia TaxID=2528005 RepID=A0A5C6A375_9BACT|nr:DUF4112 domain-containing protein [Stieleria varia]TWT93856.1 hypothetical protein Pla52n_56840 [Stieleria varia]